MRGENRQLHGKTVGIVGFGAIGRQLARLLAGFDVEIAYHDPQCADPAQEAARGGLVGEGALADALRAGHIFAAGLDAFAEEPPVGNPLLALPNTVVTPHCAAATIDNFASVAARATQNYARFLAGQALPAQDVVVPPPGR